MTSQIPIVFANVGDPVSANLVSNLARPGGNITGLSLQVGDISGKRLELAKAIVPSAKLIAIMMNPQTPYTAIAFQQFELAAAKQRVNLEAINVKSAQEINLSFDHAVKIGASLMIVIDDPLVTNLRSDIATSAAKCRMPTFYGDRLSPEAGGLAAYGPNRRYNFRRAAEFVQNILDGSKVGEIAVEQPTAFEFTLNLGSSQELSLVIPPSLLAFADYVID